MAALLSLSQDLFTLVDEAMSDDDDPISPMDSVSMIGIRMARPAAALCPSSLAPRERLQRGGGDRVRGLPAQQLRIVSSRGEAILAQVRLSGVYGGRRDLHVESFGRRPQP